jgi:hypothetical protein
MKQVVAFSIAATIMVGTAVIGIAQSPSQQSSGQAAGKQPPAKSAPDPNSQYRLGPDSMPQPGVPQGEIRGPFTLGLQCLSRNAAYILDLCAGAV